MSDQCLPDAPEREAYAIVAALAMLFTTSMTSDLMQQADQARVLNEIMARWTLSFRALAPHARLTG